MLPAASARCQGLKNCQAAATAVRHAIAYELLDIMLGRTPRLNLEILLHAALLFREGGYHRHSFKLRRKTGNLGNESCSAPRRELEKWEEKHHES